MAHPDLCLVSVCDKMLYYHATASHREGTRCSITLCHVTSPLHGPRPIMLPWPFGFKMLAYVDRGLLGKAGQVW
jgi:hypothetical protein